MNKIPKFKVWSNKHKSFYDHHEIVITPSGLVYEIEYNTQGYIRVDYLELPNITTICRFTGLFDKNDNPVYEGDVVEFYNHGIRTGVIKFNSDDDIFDIDNCSFYIKSIKPFYQHKENYTLNMNKLIIVIGNQYANPELMEVGNE